MEIIAAIDPGRDKCGIALVTTKGRVVHKAVVAIDEVAQHIRRHAEADVAVYAVGDGTAFQTVRQHLARAGVPAHRIVEVDEYKSSEIGRRAYWKERPPTGWRRFVPVGMQVPPEPYDDLVAVELARRYLTARRSAGEDFSPKA